MIIEIGPVLNSALGLMTVGFLFTWAFVSIVKTIIKAVGEEDVARIEKE